MARKRKGVKYAQKRKEKRENAAFDQLEAAADSGCEDELPFQKPLGKKQKKSKKKRGIQKRLSGPKVVCNAALLADIDVEMQEKKKPGGPPLGGGWHRISLPNASKFPKEAVLAALANSSSQPFVPVCFNAEGSSYTFYVESPSAAAALKALDKKIQMSANFLLVVKVNSSPAPKLTLNDQVLERVKAAMGKRYNAANKTLDMSNFHADPSFIGEAVYVPLSRSVVMNNVLRIISDNVPDIVAVDFSNNKLTTLDQFSILAEHTHNLAALNLSNNRLSDVRELDKLKGSKITELKLEGNPLFTKTDSQVVTDKVRKAMPRLAILDGQVLPKLRTFEDDNAELCLPEEQKKMSCGEMAEKLILQFIQQYFDAYDKDDRAPLIDAYHQDAQMSLTAAYQPGSTAHGTARLTEYQFETRNLKSVTKSSKRMKLLKQGHRNVIDLLNGLPKSLHDKASFCLDIPYADDRLINFTVCGVFKERAVVNTPLRHFNRSFVVVPHGSGFCIVNETLFVTNATHLQAKNAFNVEEATPKVAPDCAVQMVASFSQITNMRADWARKCLEETNWNLDGAVAVFQMAKAQGKIPPEAFLFKPV